MNHVADAGEFDGGSVPPKLTDQRRRPSPMLALVMFAAAVGVAILFFFNPSQHGFYPVCYFHAATGLNCAGCGSLRAMHQLLHGHVVEAARLNLLLLLCLPCLGWLTVRSIREHLRGHRTALVVRPAWLWTFLCLAIAFSVLRNLPAFGWLAP